MKTTDYPRADGPCVTFQIKRFRAARDADYDADRGEKSASAVFVAAVHRQEDGGAAIVFESHEGAAAAHDEMSTQEIFKVWMLLTKKLSETPDLQTNKRRLCTTVFEIIRNTIAAAGAT